MIEGIKVAKSLLAGAALLAIWGLFSAIFLMATLTLDAGGARI